MISLARSEAESSGQGALNDRLEISAAGQTTKCASIALIQAGLQESVCDNGIRMTDQKRSLKGERHHLGHRSHP